MLARLTFPQGWNVAAWMLGLRHKSRHKGLRCANLSGLLAPAQDGLHGCSNRLDEVKTSVSNPSHTVKNGRRYRYYFLPRAGLDFGKQSNASRLPAYDTERQISAKLQSFLRSPNELMETLSLREDHPEVTQQLLIGARKLPAELSMASPTTMQDFVRKVVRRIVVQADKLDLETSRNELRACIAVHQSAGSFKSQLHEPESDHLVYLTVEAKLKRCGKEMRLVVNPALSESEIITPILKAIARAHKWREEVLAGNNANRNLAAKRMGLKTEYFRRILGCAFLAPDILEAILGGGHPSDLTVNKLCWRYLPLDWAEQRAQLGFPPPSPSKTVIGC